MIDQSNGGVLRTLRTATSIYPAEKHSIVQAAIIQITINGVVRIVLLPFS